MLVAAEWSIASIIFPYRTDSPALRAIIVSTRLTTQFTTPAVVYASP